MSLSAVLHFRIFVYKDGNKAKVTTILPTKTLELIKRSDLTSVAEEVDEDIKEMVDEAVSKRI